MRQKLLLCLYIGALGFLLSGCLQKEETVVEGSTDAVIAPSPDPVNPDSVVCDPFEDGSTVVERTQGILASLYYLDSTQPQYTSVSDYITHGHHVSEVDIYFNQLYIPTRPFDRGFVTQGGIPIKTIEGDDLFEWFALRFDGRMQLASADVAGDYQLALLSDDGSTWKVDRTGTGNLEMIVNNDGQHGTRMGCTLIPVHLQHGDKIPFQIDYNQGPRFHISLVTMWRLCQLRVLKSTHAVRELQIQSGLIQLKIRLRRQLGTSNF